MKCDRHNLCDKATDINIKTGFCSKVDFCAICDTSIPCDEGKYILDNEVYRVTCYKSRGAPFIRSK
jgi:hypothetical protein